jgi:hypothetical protein
MAQVQRTIVVTLDEKLWRIFEIYKRLLITKIVDLDAPAGVTTVIGSAGRIVTNDSALTAILTHFLFENYERILNEYDEVRRANYEKTFGKRLARLTTRTVSPGDPPTDT